MCGRTVAQWKPETETCLPTGNELANALAQEFEYPFRTVEAFCNCHQLNHPEVRENPDDLLRVSQYVELVRDPATLNRRLSAVFSRPYPITKLHSLIAELPRYMRAHRTDECHLLVITTNYDDLMERAFATAQEPADVVYYSADDPHRGKFIHRTISGGEIVIVDPVSYNDLRIDDRSIVFKIHGDAEGSALRAGTGSFVITEDHYIDYLTRTDLSNIPRLLLREMKSSNFLFLGYSLRDWNLRAFLHRIWSERPHFFKSWAVQRSPDQLEASFWEGRNIKVLEEDLDNYVEKLAARFGITLEAAVAPTTMAAAAGPATTETAAGAATAGSTAADPITGGSAAAAAAAGSP